MLGLGLGLGLSVVTNLSAFLYALVLFHNLTTNHDPVISKRRIHKKSNVTGDFKGKLYQMMIMRFSKM